MALKQKIQTMYCFWQNNN